MKQLLGWHVDLLGLAVHHGLLPTLVPGDLLTVRPGLGGAVRGGENLAGEGVRHLGPGLRAPVSVGGLDAGPRAAADSTPCEAGAGPRSRD